MKGGWRADFIGFVSVGGFATVCVLILMGGVRRRGIISQTIPRLCNPL